MSYQISNTKILSLKDYLSNEERNKLFHYFLSNEKDFIKGNDIPFDIHFNYFFDEKVFDLFFERFNSLNLQKLIKEEFDYVFNWDNLLSRFPKNELLKVWAFQDNVEIKEHLDNLDEHEKETTERRISLMYSMFKSPKNFSGGDFISRDKYTNENNEFIKDNYPAEGTKIELEDNTLTIFDAAYPHQLTKIINQNKSFENSLFLVFFQIF